MVHYSKWYLLEFKENMEVDDTKSHFLTKKKKKKSGEVLKIKVQILGVWGLFPIPSSKSITPINILQKMSLFGPATSEFTVSQYC